MARMSTAPSLHSLDGYTSFERAVRQPLRLGLFLPHQQGAWTPSRAPRQTSWTFDYNAALAVLADELGFDLVFALATWLGKGGYGGDIQCREQALDPLIASAGLAPLTRNILLISTVHILYGWHPLHIARYGAVIDHMSGGRWGLNAACPTVIERALWSQTARYSTTIAPRCATTRTSKRLVLNSLH